MDPEQTKFCKIKRANTDWWTNERAVVAPNGKTYIGYVNDLGEVHIKEFDAKCSRAESRDVCLCRFNCDWADEHNAPCVCVLQSGRIIVAYTGHGKGHTLFYRVTEKPYDLFSFGEEKQISYEGSAAFQGGVTYAQLFENTALRQLWLFCRVNKVNWEFCFSEDYGETWSKPKRFLSYHLRPDT